MTRKARLGLYLEDETMRRQIKVAAARRGMSSTAYCTEAIRDRLVTDGEIAGREPGARKMLLDRMDNLRQEIGRVGISAAELVAEGRRR